MKHFSISEYPVDEIKTLIGDRLSTSKAVRDHHGTDSSPLYGTQAPDAVAFAESTGEVAEIVKICARQKCPVIAYGTGTASEGHFIAPYGGICIDLGAMKQILRVSEEDMDVTVQAGVTREQLNTDLRYSGLFFPVDPGADASLGGMAATNASGTTTVRYGSMRENVISLTVVLADGRVIRTASRARKSSAGYDLTRLFVGSAGTLGIITEATLRLHGLPESIAAAVCQYQDVHHAVNTVIETIQTGIPIARIEILDATLMKIVSEYSKLDYAARPTLFLEFHGSESGVAEQVESFKEISARYGGGGLQWATHAEDRNQLWKARHDAHHAVRALSPGTTYLHTDVCVPISSLADCIFQTQNELKELGITAPLIGHVGDGNFHLGLPFSPDDVEQIKQVHAINERLTMRALAMDGTCTGEHGIGVSKLDYLIAEHGEGVDVMRSIKVALDPDNIMNPGKMLRI